MSIEVIPAGSSAVVTDSYRQCRDDRDCGTDRVLQSLVNTSNEDGTRYGNVISNVREAEADAVRTTKDAEAELSRQIGSGYADTVKTVKDSEAELSRQVGSSYADTVKTIKDSDAQLSKQIGESFAGAVVTVKDAEAALDRHISESTYHLIQDVKDAESRLHQDNSDKFIQTIQDVKDVDKAISVEAARTREFVTDRHEKTRDKIDEGFIATAMAFGNAKDTTYQLAMAAERCAASNHMQTLLQFKEQALLSERLAAHQELLATALAAKQELLSEKLAAQASRETAGYYNEMKREVVGVKDILKQQEIDRLREQLTEERLLNRRFRTFSPVASGALHASDEGF